MTPLTIALFVLALILVIGNVVLWVPILVWVIGVVNQLIYGWATAPEDTTEALDV